MYTWPDDKNSDRAVVKFGVVPVDWPYAQNGWGIVEATQDVIQDKLTPIESIEYSMTLVLGELPNFNIIIRMDVSRNEVGTGSKQARNKNVNDETYDQVMSVLPIPLHCGLSDLRCLTSSTSSKLPHRLPDILARVRESSSPVSSNPDMYWRSITPCANCSGDALTWYSWRAAEMKSYFCSSSCEKT